MAIGGKAEWAAAQTLSDDADANALKVDAIHDERGYRRIEATNEVMAELEASPRRPFS